MTKQRGNKHQAKRIQRKELAQPASPWVQRVVHRPSLWLGLLTLCGVFAMTAGLNHYLRKPLLPINSVQVIGELHGLKLDELQQAIESVTDDGFFSVDVRQVKQTAEKLPWAQSVSVRRVWPDTLEIAVIEQTAVARWNENAVINQQGELFYPRPNDMPTQLPQLEGPEGTHLQLLDHYKEIQAILLGQGLSVEHIRYNNRRSLEVDLKDGPRLLLGRVRDSRESAGLVMRFSNAYQRAFKERTNNIESVDLRYTNGLAVRWRKDNVDSHNRNVPYQDKHKEHARAENKSFISGKAAREVLYG